MTPELQAAFDAQFPVKPIAPPLPAVTPDNPSQEASGVAVLIPVNQTDEE